MDLALDKPQTEQIEQVFHGQKAKSLELRSEGVGERIKRLNRLYDWIIAHREEVKQAIHRDFKKPLMEVDTSEIYPVVAEIRHAIQHLGEWVKPEKIDAPLSYMGTRSEVRFEPKGVCLIIAPWNFPFNLCVGPLVSCLAAGNTAFLKPSELTPHTSGLLKKMVSETFEEKVVALVEGGQPISTHLLTLPFDHIFFTGSPAVGKVVMRAAAENLASVTLELGGKSPALIDSSASIEDSAKRIAFGKFLNNGQTCIAPDYILVEEQLKDKFTTALKKWTIKLFGDGQGITENSASYSRIVNHRHFNRIHELIQDAIQRGARIELSGEANENERFLHPVILSGVSMDARIMEEEIFGPVLPILTYRSMEEAIRLINSKPKPLALYIFSHRKKVKENVLAHTSAGSVCINDCVLQFTHPNLPFGGVNNSGIGKSHGYAGFLAFSNEKPVLRQKRGFSGAYLLYPPYTTRMKKIVDVLIRWF